MNNRITTHESRDLKQARLISHNVDVLHNKCACYSLKELAISLYNYAKCLSSFLVEIVYFEYNQVLKITLLMNYNLSVLVEVAVSLISIIISSLSTAATAEKSGVNRCLQQIRLPKPQAVCWLFH